MKSARTLPPAGHLRFLLVALPLLLAVGPNSCRPIDVQCGDVLALDHAQYWLTGDLECPDDPSGAAVTITGEGVHFNLRGHTITRDDGTGRLLTSGILVRGANAHINGGSIVDINCPDAPAREDCAAIHLLAAPGVRINGMSLNNNVIGIKTIGSTRNVDGARIHDNDITGNLRFGIGLFASAEGAQITGNDLSDTGGFPGGQGFGIVLASFGASVNGNIANNCARSGILLFGDEIDPPGQRNTVRDNTTLDNGRSGIVSLGGGGEEFRPRDNLIQSNTSFGNGVRDLGEVIGGPPPVFPADCLNTWRDNDFDVATQDCIE